MPAIIVTTRVNARGWILVPVSVGGVWRGDFVLSTIASTSSVSAGTATVLDAIQCLARIDRRTYLLKRLAIGTDPVRDLVVRVGPAATLTRVEGILGLDFLSRFASVCFDVAEQRLTLEFP